VILRIVDDFNGPELEQALQIYRSSFPAVETRPVAKVQSMLKSDDNYHLYVAVEDSTVVGMALLYGFPELHIGLLDYMAVLPEYQRRGIGSKLFSYVLGEFSCENPKWLGLLLEVQVESVADSKERTERESRIKFYLRLGAKILLGVHYLIPPQHGTSPEETYLMIVPHKRIQSLSKDTVCRYIRAIYARVYDYSGNALLQMIAEKMPVEIELSNIIEVHGRQQV
jgi:GNAT superfamily N-acetyltransferase